MQATVANKGGRPASFTQALADEVCDRISNGEPLAAVCRDDRMPHRSTVAGWCLAKPEFAANYAFAREIGFDAIAAECLEIADDRSDDPASRRVRTDVRLKLLAKWDPKRFGDKIDLNASGVGEIRIVVGGDTN